MIYNLHYMHTFYNINIRYSVCVCVFCYHLSNRPCWHCFYPSTHDLNPFFGNTCLSQTPRHNHSSKCLRMVLFCFRLLTKTICPSAHLCLGILLHHRTSVEGAAGAQVESPRGLVVAHQRHAPLGMQRRGVQPHTHRGTLTTQLFRKVNLESVFTWKTSSLPEHVMHENIACVHKEMFLLLIWNVVSQKYSFLHGKANNGEICMTFNSRGMCCSCTKGRKDPICSLSKMLLDAKFCSWMSMQNDFTLWLATSFCFYIRNANLHLFASPCVMFAQAFIFCSIFIKPRYKKPNLM